MAVPFLDLQIQYSTLKDELEPAVLEVMRSCGYVGGKYVAEFEKNMADYLGVKYAISCANGTDAIILALRAMNIGSGDEVITSPFTFFATAEAIAVVGAIPVFVDIHEDDFNIDANKIEEKISNKTKAILPVHIFGSPCDLDSIHRIARKHKLGVIEDAAQAIGSEYNGQKIGTISDMSCFSFYPTKNLGALGDGGMITTNYDDLATILIALKEHGAGKNGAKAREIISGIKDEIPEQELINSLYDPYKYYNYMIGYNSRLDAMQAMALNIKLRHLDSFNRAREKIANQYTSELASEYIKPNVLHGKSCWHQYVIRTDHKNELSEFLSKKGIGTGAFYPVPLHLQKVFEGLGYQPGSLPVTEKIAAETVCLPIFPELEMQQISEVISVMNDYIKQVK